MASPRLRPPMAVSAPAALTRRPDCSRWPCCAAQLAAFPLLQLAAQAPPVLAATRSHHGPPPPADPGRQTRTQISALSLCAACARVAHARGTLAHPEKQQTRHTSTSRIISMPRDGHRSTPFPPVAYQRFFSETCDRAIPATQHERCSAEVAAHAQGAGTLKPCTRHSFTLSPNPCWAHRTPPGCGASVPAMPCEQAHI